jgi:hypothetical protein
VSKLFTSPLQPNPVAPSQTIEGLTNNINAAFNSFLPYINILNSVISINQKLKTVTIATGYTINLNTANIGTAIVMGGTNPLVMTIGSNSFTFDSTGVTTIANGNLQLTGTAGLLVAPGGFVSIQAGGTFQYGAYTAGAPAATGYITFKASSGVTYKWLVST